MKTTLVCTSALVLVGMLAAGCASASDSDPSAAASTSLETSTASFVVTSEGSANTAIHTTVLRAADRATVATLDWSATDHRSVYTRAAGPSTTVAQTQAPTLLVQNLIAADLAGDGEEKTAPAPETSQTPYGCKIAGIQYGGGCFITCDYCNNSLTNCKYYGAC